VTVKEGETESLLVCVSRVKNGKINNSIDSRGCDGTRKKGRECIGLKTRSY